MKSEKGVTHWSDGEKTWTLGVEGFIIQVRGYIVQIILAVPLMGAPFWWREDWPKSFSLPTSSLILHLAVCALVFGISSTLYLRHRVKRSLRLKATLHNLVHHLRDSLCERQRVVSGRRGREGAQSAAHNHRHLCAATREACNHIASYFSVLTGDDSVGCAIRVLELGGAESDGLVYVTIGRSDKLNSSRGETSQPISRDAGIPKFFMADDKSGQGILFFDDLTKATAVGAYLRTKNDDLFDKDFSSMAVAPLNALNGKGRELIGLMCVTSRTGKVLQVRHIDLFKFFADLMAGFFMAYDVRFQNKVNGRSSA